MAGYIRQSTFVDGDTITAALFNNEYNQLVNAFSNTSGHKHDGTTAEGPVIGLIGDAGETSPNNKVLIDTTNNYIEFYVEVSSAPVQQIYIADGAIIPVTDNDIDLGTSSLEFKDIYIDGTATIDTLTVDEAATVGTTLGVTGATTLSSTLGVTGATTLSSTLAVTGATTLSSTLAVTGTSTLTGNVTATNDLSVGGNLTVTGNATISGNLTFGDADTDSINLSAEIDSNIVPNTDDTYDLGTSTKQWRNLYIDGTAEIDTLAIDGTTVTSTAAELNILDGVTSTAAELNILDGVTSTTAELNILDGVTATAAEINLLDGVTSTTAELNILDGVTATATEINLLDGVTSTTAELNILDGVTSTATELNIVDGDTAATSTTLADADRVVVNDAGTMKQVALTDFETYFEGALDTLSNVTTVGALNAGSITSGFGAIDNGSSAITTTGTVTYGNLSDGTITITAFVDEDDMSSNSATLVPTQQSVKAYVDTTVAATNEVVEDSTPQLGGDLDLNSNDITGTGNINITGTIQSSGNITGTLATAAQPNITSLGTLTTLTIDDITINGSTISDGADLTLDVGGNLLVDVDNGMVRYYDAGTEWAQFKSNSQDVQIISIVQDKDIIFRGNDGGSYFNALTLDMSDAGKALFNAGANFGSGIDVTGTVTADGLTVDGTGDLGTIGNGAFNQAAALGFQSDRAFFGYSSSQNALIQSGSGKGVVIEVNNDTLDSGTRAALFAANGDISFYEDTGTSQALFWDASAESLGIGTTSPQNILHTDSASTGEVVGLALSNSNTSFSANEAVSIKFGVGSATALAHGKILVANTDSGFGSNGYMAFHTRGSDSVAERMRIDSSGKVGIGTNNPASLLHIESASAPTLRIDDSDSTNALEIAQDGANGSVLLKSAGELSLGVANDSSSDAVSLKTRNQTRLYVKEDGNVGIGTSNPAKPLEISASGGSAVIRLTNTDSVVSSGEALGSIEWQSNDASTPGGTGTQGIIKVIDSNTFGNAYDMTFSTGDGGSTTEKMRIDSSGNVGIGKTSPAAELDVFASSTPAVRVADGSGFNIRLEAFGSNTAGLVCAGGSTNMTFQTNETERMRIDSSGKVGIGVTPSEALHIEYNTVSGGDNFIHMRKTDQGAGQGAFIGIPTASNNLRIMNHAANSITFHTTVSDTERMRIDSSGRVGIGTTDTHNRELCVKGGSS